MTSTKPKPITSLDIELAVAKFFNPRVHLIVPNVSWGFFMHELDLCVITKSGYCYEIEIKVSKSDLKRDLLKPHNHFDHRIKHLFFAIPKHLYSSYDLIPESAGILVVERIEDDCFCQLRRKPASQSTYKFSDGERYQISRLGALRIWGLKRKIQELNNL